MSEQQEVEGWALYASEQYANGKPHEMIEVRVKNPRDQDFRPVVIAPKPLWDQRMEAVRGALKLLERAEVHFGHDRYIAGWLCVEDAQAVLRAIPWIEGGA